MWHVSSRSGVETLRTAIHLLLAYLLTVALHGQLLTSYSAARPRVTESRMFRDR